MGRRGYWLVEYLPISRLIRRAQAQYARAFLETETDGGDTTYFLIHQLKIIERSINDLHRYLQRKIAEVRNVELLLHGDGELNGRQLALLTDAVRHPEGLYSFESHATSHRVSHDTARSDLRQLVRRRRGRMHVFEPAPDIEKRLKESPA
jgi:Fic family protein